MLFAYRHFTLPYLLLSHILPKPVANHANKHKNRPTSSNFHGYGFSDGYFFVNLIKSMERTVLGSFVVVFISFLSCFSFQFQMGLAQTKDMINWDDLKVDNANPKLSSRDNFNLTQVIIVDKDGRGDSLTVQGAIDLVPENNTARVKIYILPGIYREKVLIPRNKPYISFIGKENQISDTIITWNNKASDTDSNGDELGTYKSASVTIESNYFCATGITFENTVVAVPGGYGMQAVALRVSGDKAFFYRVRILGTQDTLLDETGSHFYYQCHIQGSVDFIFGRGRSLFQECELQSTARKSGAIAAHHRDTPDDDSGFSFVGCVINGTGKVLLGRAWGNYSRTIYSYCYLDDIITPPGWSDWNFPYRQKTVVFGEYECSGRGADTRARVPWSKSFTYKEVRPFLDMNFINGEQWLRL